MSTSNLKQAKGRQITPLAIIALFISLTETIATLAVTQTSGTVQLVLTVFVIFFPILNAVGFFVILWSRPYSFYPPAEFGGGVKPREYVEAMRGAPLRRNHSAKGTIHNHRDEPVAGGQDVNNQITK